MLRKLPINRNFLMSAVKKPCVEIALYQAPEKQIIKMPEIDPLSEILERQRCITDFFKLKNVEKVVFDPEKMKQLAAELEETKKYSVY